MYGCASTTGTRAGGRGWASRSPITGRGSTESVRGRLFHPFFTTKGDAGTGLGLWVSRGVILRHEGSIRVRTSTAPSGKGTCFHIFLPR